MLSPCLSPARRRPVPPQTNLKIETQSLTYNSEMEGGGDFSLTLSHPPSFSIISLKDHSFARTQKVNEKCILRFFVVVVSDSFRRGPNRDFMNRQSKPRALVPALLTFYSLSRDVDVVYFYWRVARVAIHIIRALFTNFHYSLDENNPFRMECARFSLFSRFHFEPAMNV